MSMKLTNILEMAAYATKSAHQEYTSTEVNQAKSWLLSGGTKQAIEGSKFYVVHKVSSIGLFRASDDEILGWVTLKPTTELFGTTVHPLGNIQILPKYRNTVAVLMLINAVRTLLHHPVYVDDPIFLGGESLLKAMVRRSDLPSVFTVDKRTGERTPFAPGDLAQPADIGILLEHASLAFTWVDKYPGGEREIVLSLFEQFHNELLS